LPRAEAESLSLSDTFMKGTHYISPKKKGVRGEGGKEGIPREKVGNFFYYFI
jgi:hypothetical protein